MTALSVGDARGYNRLVTLRELRRDLGITLRELERRTSVSRAYLSQIETGLRAPTPEQIVRVAAGLGVPLERLSVRVFVVVEQ